MICTNFYSQTPEIDKMSDKQRIFATPTVSGLHQPGQPLKPVHDVSEYMREYAREKPEVVALWCLGIGIVLGWKLKPW